MPSAYLWECCFAAFVVVARTPAHLLARTSSYQPGAGNDEELIAILASHAGLDVSFKVVPHGGSTRPHVMHPFSLTWRKRFGFLARRAILSGCPSTVAEVRASR